MARKPPKPKTISPARVRRLASQPGTRAALADKYLTPEQLRQRQMNQRLNQPLVPGSTTTYRDAARQASSAAQVKYGQAEQQANQSVGQSQQLERDQAAWYDQYLKELAQHEQNISNIGGAANTAQQSLMNAMPSTATQGLSGENQTIASNAAAVRQAILGSFGATTNAQGAAANRYADTLAHVVGPTQQLSARVQAAGGTKSARDALAALLKEKGAFRQSVIDDAKTSEAKNVLSMQALGLDQAKAQSQTATEQARISETHRHNVAAEQNTAASRKAAGGKVNQYGYTDSEWRSMTTQQRQKAIRDYKRNTAGPGQGGKKWATNESQGKASDQIDKALGILRSQLRGMSRSAAAQYLTQGVKDKPVFDKNGKKVLNPDGTQKTTGSVPQFDPLWASVALDVMYDGHVSRNNVMRLHARGIKVNSLGYPTKVSRTQTLAQKGVQGVKKVI